MTSERRNFLDKNKKYPEIFHKTIEVAIKHLSVASFHPPKLRTFWLRRTSSLEQSF